MMQAFRHDWRHADRYRNIQLTVVSYMYDSEHNIKLCAALLQCKHVSQTLVIQILTTTSITAAVMQLLQLHVEHVAASEETT